MPEIDQTWAYPAFWIIAILVAGSMLALFRRLDHEHAKAHEVAEHEVAEREIAKVLEAVKHQGLPSVLVHHPMSMPQSIAPSRFAPSPPSCFRVPSAFVLQTLYALAMGA
jgi:hypothetical protein